MVWVEITMVSSETTKENSWDILKMITLKFLIIFWISKK